MSTAGTFIENRTIAELRQEIDVLRSNIYTHRKEISKHRENMNYPIEFRVEIARKLCLCSVNTSEKYDDYEQKKSTEDISDRQISTAYNFYREYYASLGELLVSIKESIDKLPTNTCQQNDLEQID